MKTLFAKPFVKWAGGKTLLLDEVKQSLPTDLCQHKNITYIEPFVGGGAVLFWILQEYPNITHAVINDVNPELICTYQTIKNRPTELIDQLERMQMQYIRLDTEGRKDYFLGKRRLFNSKQNSDITTAALFIFLNKTCFNGLYRVNSKGEFNVPHGKYANPKICDRDNLLAVSQLLQRVDILCGDFSDTLKFAAENTIFYLDPPYKPISNTSSFTTYTIGGFDDTEQVRLRDFCEQLSQQGALFVASNSDPIEEKTGKPFFDQLYYRFRIKRVCAPRFINANPNNRGAVSEIMISNVVNT